QIPEMGREAGHVAGGGEESRHAFENELCSGAVPTRDHRAARRHRLRETDLPGFFPRGQRNDESCFGDVSIESDRNFKMVWAGIGGTSEGGLVVPIGGGKDVGSG